MEKKKTKGAGQVEISVIVPCYNEAQTIRELLDRIRRSLGGHSFEVIVVDDGSSDGTREILEKLGQEGKYLTVMERDSRGKASAILEGFRVSKGSLVAFIDSDLQYLPEDIPKLMHAAGGGKDIVVGKRLTEERGLRRMLSLAFTNIFGRLLLGLPVTDVQSGLKVMKREVLENMDIKASTWDLDVELLYKAKGKWRIGEVPIRFEKRGFGETKVGVLGASWKLGVRAIKLRLLG